MNNDVLGMWYLDAVMGENRGLKLSQLYLWIKPRKTGSSTLIIDGTDALERELRHLVLDNANSDAGTGAKTKVQKVFLKADDN